MSSSQHNLTLDEQSFQGLLAAAFIIQEHNDRRKLAQPAPAESEGERVGEHCGTLEAADASCSNSSGENQFRPGERLQRNWASMWLMSQERDLWPVRSTEIGETPAPGLPPVDVDAGRRPQGQAGRDPVRSGFLSSSVTPPVAEQIRKKTSPPEEDEAIHNRELDRGDYRGHDRGLGNFVFGDPTLHQRRLNHPALNEAATESQWTPEAVVELSPADLAREDWTGEDADLTVEPFLISARDEFSPDDGSVTTSLRQRMADWRVKLRFRRADLYLGTAIFVAALALLWPVAGSPRRAPLSAWERALVTLGIADAPAPVIHLQGDPGVSVWVDPHTALYYCPGEEQYGKTADGRMSSQREAQMDRFEPAGRSACE